MHASGCLFNLLGVQNQKANFGPHTSHLDKRVRDKLIFASPMGVELLVHRDLGWSRRNRSLFYFRIPSFEGHFEKRKDSKNVENLAPYLDFINLILFHKRR